MSSAPETFTGTSRFEVQRYLGRGAMGQVYQVLDHTRGHVVALKTLRRQSPEALYRFKQEFRNLADLSHPNLVTLHELVQDGDRWFFTMEMIDGVDLLRHIRGDDPPPTERPEIAVATTEAGVTLGGPASPPPDLDAVRRAMRQLVEGVAALHDDGKLHRDIKPKNVLVTPGGRVVVLDFGLVAHLRDTLDSSDRTLVGTAGYVSPEQGAGLPAAEPSDWYSVGVVLYEVLTGRLPLDGPPLAVLMEKQRVDPVPPDELLPELPPDLCALCVALLSRDPASRPAAAEILARLGGVPAPRTLGLTTSQGAPALFIGRARHLDALERALDESLGGRAVAALVRGSSGMGKSALIDRFARAVTGDNRAVILSGRCYERESVPYKGLDSLIDELHDYLIQVPSNERFGLLPADVGALARLFPVLRGIPGADARDVAGDPHELRRRGTAALGELLSRMARMHTLVITIDDIQWGDLDSAAILGDILRAPLPPPILVVLCFRAEEEDSDAVVALRESLAQAPALSVREIAVDALTDDESRELARSLLGPDDGASSVGALTDTLTDALADAIAVEAQGNPFFVDELVRYVHTSGGLDVGALSLQDAIGARVDQLADPARRLLELIAVAGRPLDPDLATRAAEIEAGDASALSTLRAGHLVRSAVAGGQPAIVTYHDRIRETVVARLTDDALRARHGRLAAVLAATGRADPDDLAVHYRGAGDRERAGEHAAAAGDNASRALAFDRAAALYQRAVDDLPDDAVERMGLRARLGDALANAGRGGEAAQAYLAAAHTANAADALELRRRAAEQQLSAGYIDDGLDTLRAVLRAVGMRLAESPRRALASLMARRLRLRLRGLRFTERDPSQIAAETLTRIDICWSASHGLGTIDTIRGADFQVRHLLLALNAGEPFRVSRALAMECMYSAVAGQATWSRTQRLLADARRLAEQIDDDRARGMAMLAEALAEYQAGRYQAAFDCFEAGIAIFSERCTGVAFEIAGCRRFGLDSLFNLGELGELSRRVPQYLREAERRGDLYAAMDMRTGLPNVAWLVAGDPDEAVRQAQEGIERWSQRGFHLQHYYSALAHANAALYRGDSARARACVIDIWPSLRRSLLLRIQALRAEALMLRGRAAAAHALRERDADALSESRTMADKLVKERIPAARPSAALLRASAALWHGDREACMDTLAAAERGFEAADMALMAAVCLRRRGQLMGGDAGRALVERSDAWMRGQSIREPEPMTSLYLIHPDEARPPR